MKPVKCALLHRIEIDQYIPATHHTHPRERWVIQQIMAGENTQIPDSPANLKHLPLSDEVAR
jgi:hypothetical protein